MWICVLVFEFLLESKWRPRNWQSRALSNWASFTSSRMTLESLRPHITNFNREATKWGQEYVTKMSPISLWTTSSLDLTKSIKHVHSNVKCTRNRMWSAHVFTCTCCHVKTCALHIRFPSEELQVEGWIILVNSRPHTCNTNCVRGPIRGVLTKV